MNASSLKEGIVDRVLLFLAPKIIGGRQAPGMIGGEGILRMREAGFVQILRIKRSGPDILIEGEIQNRPRSTDHGKK